jgi:undecaprenyl-diphosphatase
LNLNGAIFDRLNDDLAGRYVALDDLMKFAATYLIYVIAGVAIASWFARFGSGENRRIGVYSAVISAAISVGIAALISSNYDHPRPFMDRGDVVLLIHHAADSSFPSDHASAAFAFAAGLGLYRPRFGIALLLLACLVAVGRVFVGVHYPGDVAGGALIGIGVALVIWLLRPALFWLDRVVVQRLIPQPLL